MPPTTVRVSGIFHYHAGSGANSRFHPILTLKSAFFESETGETNLKPRNPN